jgi:carboxypeptidase C (cathepsin A)
MRLLSCFALCLTAALAQPPRPAPEATPAKPSGAAAEAAKPAAAPAPEEKPVVRRHEITLNGQPLSYTTTAQLMPIRNEKGEIEARIFYMAYTLDGVKEPAKRRLTFSFNGGPGSASVWLHLGALGPKRVKLNDDGSLPPPPYQLAPNEASWLDLTDLVFIDPVGTGYSRAEKPELLEKFTSRQGDVQSVGEFIRLYLTRNRRWLSPLFLTGESYGTTRAAGLAGYLIEHGIAFNGIALISTVLNFQTLDFNPGNDLPYPLILPTYTATAWYHKRLPPVLQSKPLPEVLKEVEAWAGGPYTLALTQGDSLAAAQRKAIIDRLASYTGLSAATVGQAELRLDLSYFNRELLRDKNLIVGRLDSRLTGPGRRDLSNSMEYDPSMSTIRPPYTAAFYQYVRDELGYESDADYYILGGGFRRWNMNAENEYANVSESLRRAFTRNPFMKVYVGMGYYDMATPYFAAEYTFDHLGLPAGAHDNLIFRKYPAGHMYYIDLPSLRQMKKDIADFLNAAAPVN